MSASAERLFFLVGYRHTYRISAYPDPHEFDREQLEERYAGAIDTAQHHYEHQLAKIVAQERAARGVLRQEDRDNAQYDFEGSIAYAADERDKALSQYYTPADDFRTEHAELGNNLDGAYYVVGIDEDAEKTPTSVVYYQPYPGYVGQPPFGWSWGVVYGWDSYTDAGAVFRKQWEEHGRPLFFGLSLRGKTLEVTAPVRSEVVQASSQWVGGRPPVFTEETRSSFADRREAQFRSGPMGPPPANEINRPHPITIEAPTRDDTPIRSLAPVEIETTHPPERVQPDPIRGHEPNPPVGSPVRPGKPRPPSDAPIRWHGPSPAKPGPARPGPARPGPIRGRQPGTRRETPIVQRPPARAGAKTRRRIPNG